MNEIKMRWFNMLEAPWRHSGSNKERVNHWLTWILGWAWTLSGIILGALIAPELVQLLGTAATPFKDWFAVGIAVVVGFSVQALGWCLLIILYEAPTNAFLYFMLAIDKMGVRFSRSELGYAVRMAVSVTFFAFLTMLQFVGMVLPLMGVAYGIYRYLTWVGAGQREVTIAFVGGLLVKTFLIPLIKGIVTGALFKWFMNWLRGGKGKDAKSA